MSGRGPASTASGGGERRGSGRGRVPSRPGGRTFARLAAVQALYQIEQNRNRPEAVVEEFEQHRLAPPPRAAQEGSEGAAAAALPEPPDPSAPEESLAIEADRAWFRDLVTGTSARLAEIDGHLNAALGTRRDVARMEVILRAILRAGTYELLARIDTPTAVVIAEYVALTHDFFGKTEADLVNAVLDRIGREVRHGA